MGLGDREERVELCNVNVMEKIICKSSEHQLMSSPGYAVPNHQIDYLVGRVCTLVEAAGMSTSQEKAVKDLIRQEIYGALQEHTTYLPGTLMSVVQEYKYKEQEMAQKEGLPSGHDADFELIYSPKL